MSQYTTEVRFICENLADLTENEGYLSVSTIIDKARPKLFNFDYPIFDEVYRPVLENKILRHFYTREIGVETYGLWKLRLEAKLNEIMPYYNKLYESEQIKFNPITSHDLTTDHKGNGTSLGIGKEVLKDVTAVDTTVDSTNNTVTNHTANGDVWNLYSDTPQGGIKGIQGAEDDPSLGDNGYLTNATHVIDNSRPVTNTNTTGHTVTDQDGTLDRDRDTTNNVKTTNDYLNYVSGYAGYSPNKLLAEYRKNLLNIDMLIMNDLEDLFFQLW